MAGLYILAGFNHFLNPKIYERIIPPFFRFKKLINKASGLAEILLGIGLLIPSVQHYAAIGLIILLIAIFPANVYHLMQRGAGMKIPVWVLWLRLPLQGVLIWWAWLYV